MALCFCVLGLVSLAPAAWAQQDSPLAVNLVVLKPTLDADGKEVLVNAAEATPGQILVYRVTYRNNGTSDMKAIVASLPVPAGLAYQEASATPAAAQASVDGKTFFDVAQPPKDTPAATWRVIRWAPHPALSPGKEFTVEIHARVLKTGE
jgi:uncharacterized repeat protein (TIGR01451 family)